MANRKLVLSGVEGSQIAKLAFVVRLGVRRLIAGWVGGVLSIALGVGLLWVVASPVALAVVGAMPCACPQRAALVYVRSPSPGPLLATGSGVITGTVTNGTTGHPMPNWPVTLLISDNTNPLEDRAGVTDAAGNFRFEALPTDPELAYAVTAEYPAGLPYGTDIASFQAGQTALSLPLVVYDVIAEDTGVRADRVHFIVEFDAGQLWVAELFVFSLDGNRTYIGDDTGVLRFKLPPDAQGLQVSDGELGGRYVATADGFVDTAPLLPGNNTRQILFRYAAPYTGDSTELVFSLSYPVANVNALVPDIGPQVTSAQLPDRGVRQTENGNYITLSGQDFAANQSVTLRFTGLSAISQSSRVSPGVLAAAPGPAANRAILLIVIGLVGTGIGLLAAWPLLRGRTLREGGSPAAIQGDRAALVDALARLDLAHEAGEVSDASYQDQRLRLKARLLDLMPEESSP